MRYRIAIVLLGVACWNVAAQCCPARTVLRNICRVKGQEENVLRGLGLVIGLAGTGEAADPATMRALARAMEIMNAPVPALPLAPSGGLKDLEKVKNVALVMVTARVPAAGARRGDKLDCHVSAINGKSLNGGRLAFAALQGPNTQDPRVYAMCEGAIHLENAAQPLVGVVAGGCQMEEDVITPFVQDGRITLILDEYHANFQTATDVAESIHALYTSEGENFARARNAANIEIMVPERFRDDPALFVAEVLEATIFSPEPEARVVINQKTGSIVISGDVTIGDVVVSHKNVVIEAGQSAEFASVGLDRPDDPRLQSLVTALNSIKVPHADVVEIIKGIAHNGKLHGRLVIE
ncbi:MAG TPA: flagellar basal body P-ring protein FlgI [Lacipirellulaceae bacterium]|nr:flagellar basal body P-ring protein FlgI [Lacipirellulaceae bacterium]